MDGGRHALYMQRNISDFHIWQNGTSKKCSWFTHQLTVLALYMICSIFSSFLGCETFTFPAAAFQRDNISLISDLTTMDTQSNPPRTQRSVSAVLNEAGSFMCVFMLPWRSRFAEDRHDNRKQLLFPLRANAGIYWQLFNIRDLLSGAQCAGHKEAHKGLLVIWIPPDNSGAHHLISMGVFILNGKSLTLRSALTHMKTCNVIRM